MVSKIIQYFSTYSNQYFGYLLQHLKLSAISLTIAIVIGIPIGYMSYRNEKVSELIVSMSQFLRIIPSLTVLFILIPLIGVGELSALVALSFLAIPPVIINTILGFKEVPGVVKEVGLGMGMSGKQMMTRIEFPLALPYILNGVKLAWTEIIASATLATYIGAGGLGTLIFTGLGLYRLELIIIGGGTVTLLSLISMFVFDRLIERMATYNG